MSDRKNQENLPLWLQRIKDKGKEEIPQGGGASFSAEDLDRVWSRIEETLDHRRRSARIIYFRRIFTLAASFLLLMGVGLGIYRFLDVRRGVNTTENTHRKSSNLAEQRENFHPSSAPEKKEEVLSVSRNIRQPESEIFENLEGHDSPKPQPSSLKDLPLSDEGGRNFEGMTYPPRFDRIGVDVIAEVSASGLLLAEAKTPVGHAIVTVDIPNREKYKNSFVQRAYDFIEYPQSEEGSDRLSFASMSSFASPFIKRNPGVLSNIIRSNAKVPDLIQSAKVNEDPLYQKAVFKHSVPFRMEGRLSYDITDRFWIETGLRYTLLFSKVTDYDPMRTISQYVHYLGVPISLNLRLYSHNRWSVYTGMELGVDKVLTGTFDGGVLPWTPWQFSVGMHAGVSFNIIPELSFYMAPGFSYYIKNNSPLRTYFQEKPFNFSFSLGVRFLPFNRW